MTWLLTLQVLTLGRWYSHGLWLTLSVHRYGSHYYLGIHQSGGYFMG